MMLYYHGFFEGQLEINGLELFVRGEMVHCNFVMFIAKCFCGM